MEDHNPLSFSILFSPSDDHVPCVHMVTSEEDECLVTFVLGVGIPCSPTLDQRISPSSLSSLLSEALEFKQYRGLGNKGIDGNGES